MNNIRQDSPGDPLTQLVDARLRELGISPSPRCSDAEFLRRLFLDLLGVLPTAAEVRQFLGDTNPGKRERAIAAALERPECIDRLAMHWCDLLRMKSEFPINLWPNAVQAYATWVQERVRDNTPYDAFVAQLLLGNGSNFRSPAANFLRAVGDRSPAGLARATALTFLGTRIEHWPAKRQQGFAHCFSGVAYKSTREWKEEIVYFDDRKVMQALPITMPDGSEMAVPPGTDPRLTLWHWLQQEPSHALARAHCNRMWSWLFGPGIVEAVDDLRPDNPPSCPALLDYLATRFVQCGWDQRAVLREILCSQTYQRSCLATGKAELAARHFACQSVRRLDAEVLIDVLCQVTATTESYISEIPEPFTRAPVGTPARQLADGSMTSSFLELFARSPRDSGLSTERNHRPTANQRLHLLNSSHIRGKLEAAPFLQRLAPNEEGIDTIYLTLLGRYPTSDELAAISAHAAAHGLASRALSLDLAWALVNTVEFLYRH